MGNDQTPTAVSWSAGQYLKFEKERNRPIEDLLSRTNPQKVQRVIDLGCGPGNSTEFLVARYPDIEVNGIDSSPEMIAAAKERLPGVHFEIADISTWEKKGLFDIILANASLQWVPDHETLFPKLMDMLDEGGTLAVQVPESSNEPAHRLIREMASRPPWSDKVRNTDRIIMHGADFYLRLLKDKASSLDIWRTTYFHILRGGAAAIVEWFKGTALRPLTDQLTRTESEIFLKHYLEEIAIAYPEFEDGSVVLPFPRLFIVAKK
jgi:trans-aconitate 2-methyltransferase